MVGSKVLGGGSRIVAKMCVQSKNALLRQQANLTSEVLLIIPKQLTSIEMMMLIAPHRVHSGAPHWTVEIQ